MDLIAQIVTELQAGDDEKVAALTRQGLDAGLAAKQLLDDGLVAGMAVVGEQFRNHEIFLPDVLLAAKAMYAGLELLKPILESGAIAARGTVVLGSVAGDLHDIGKNLVAIMLKGAGFAVIDLGHDVPAAGFVDAAEQHGAQVIGCSALLTTTMPVMRQVAELLRQRGLTERIKLIVGGAPLSQAYADEIGAAAYGFDAVRAVELVSALCEGGA